MVERTLHLPVAAQDSLEDVVEYAVLGEEYGYEHAWLPETWGRDAVTLLTRIATETDTIGIGPSIVNVYSRSPALVGQTAATLQEASEGRFRLGLGPSGPAVIEGWHGASFDRPLRRTREYIEIVRAVLAGDVLNYDGDVFSLGGFRFRCDPPETPVPIEAAAMGPKSVELAGRFADGWHAVLFTPEGISDRLEDLERGVELGDRNPEDVTVTLSVTAAALEDGDRARELGRGHLAFYVGAMGTYYRESLARQGYEAEATAIAEAVANRDQERIDEVIDDELLEAFGIGGTPDEAREQLERWEDVEAIDEIAIGFPRGATPEEIESTIDALVPES